MVWTLRDFRGLGMRKFRSEAFWAKGFRGVEGFED